MPDHPATAFTRTNLLNEEARCQDTPAGADDARGTASGDARGKQAESPDQEQHAASDPQRGRMPERILARAAAEGWYMFPLVPETKRPLVTDWEGRAVAPDTEQELLAAGWQPECAARWAQAAWPGRDNGIACGPTGWVVLDLDTSLDGQPCGAESLLRRADEHEQPVPLTRMHLTRSGGWQLVFLAIEGRPIRNSSSKSGEPLIGRNVDVRGQGGYVVAPGSYVGPDRKSGGWYKIADDRPPVQLPEWIAGLLDPPKPERSLRPASAANRVRAPAGRRAARGSPRARLTGLVAAVLAEGELGQNRNKALHWAACRAAEMAAGGLVSRAAAMVALEEAGTRAGLNAT